MVNVMFTRAASWGVAGGDVWGIFWRGLGLHV